MGKDRKSYPEPDLNVSGMTSIYQPPKFLHNDDDDESVYNIKKDDSISISDFSQIVAKNDKKRDKDDTMNSSLF